MDLSDQVSKNNDFYNSSGSSKNGPPASRSETASQNRPKPPPVERFRTNMKYVSELVCELIQTANDKGCNVVDVNLAKLGILVLESYDPVTIIENFIKRSHQYWGKIHQKDQDFFDEHLDVIFEGIPSESRKAFSQLVKAVDSSGSQIIDKEYRDDIWRYIQSFVRIAIDYIHQKRQPDLFEKEGKLYPVYRQKFLSEIKIDEHAETWGIEFAFTRRAKTAKSKMNPQEY